MGLIEDVRALIGDAFLTLPLMMTGFVFLFGILTSNTGLLYLFIGQLLLVPSVGFLTNLYERPFFKDKVFSIGRSIQFVFSVIGLLTINSISTEYGTPFGWLTAVTISLQWLLNGRSPAPTPATSCAVIPTQEDDAGSIYTTPSMWVLHLCFFIFFLLSNAKNIFDLPTPEITKFQDEKTLKSRQARLESRVNTRKTTAVIVMIVSIVLLLALLAFRFNRTECEKGFFASFPAIILVCLTGYNYFNVLVEFCGVRPADVLGIVPGILNPDITDTPIVCVGD